MGKNAGLSCMAKKKLSKKEAEALSIANEKYRQDTHHALGDKLFNWILDRYTKNGRAFKFSDAFVWKGSVYVLPEIFGYMIFFAIFLFLAHLSFKRYGDARTIVFFILLAIWRLNIIVKQLSKLNAKF